MDMRALMKQAQKMQETIRREMAELRVEASVGGGMVSVAMAGNHDLVSVTIAPEVLEAKDVEMLEDLVRAAVNEANRKIEETLGQKMGSLKVPGF